MPAAPLSEPHMELSHDLDTEQAAASTAAGVGSDCRAGLGQFPEQLPAPARPCCASAEGKVQRLELLRVWAAADGAVWAPMPRGALALCLAGEASPSAQLCLFSLPAVHGLLSSWDAFLAKAPCLAFFSMVLCRQIDVQ